MRKPRSTRPRRRPAPTGGRVGHPDDDLLGRAVDRNAGAGEGVRRIGEGPGRRHDGRAHRQGVRVLEGHRRFLDLQHCYEAYDHPYLNLTDAARDAEGIDPVALETAIADELVAFDGVAYAIPSSRLREGALPENASTRAVLNNFNPDRSGDIYVVFHPGWFINDFDGLSVTVTHGSPCRYDTYVPIIFAAWGRDPQRVSRRVHTVDVAITLSAIADARPPDGAAGEVLPEVVGR
jgi:hypothetical protein